jgi:hypothetical protein
MNSVKHFRNGPVAEIHGREGRLPTDPRGRGSVPTGRALIFAIASRAVRPNSVAFVNDR